MFTVQYTTSAFNGNRDVPEGQWRNHSGHETYPQAEKAVRKLVADMRARCAPASWDSNYRIISDVDAILETTFHCDGHLTTEGRFEPCLHLAMRTIRWTWEAGPEPPHPDARGYNGWKFIPIEIVEQTGPDGDWGARQCLHCLGADPKYRA